MGTSTSRRGPAGPAWRGARRAATRYLTPEDGPVVTAQEVAARYVAALEEGGGQEAFLARFRQARRTAQEVGAFWSDAVTRGLPRALGERGLEHLAKTAAEVLAPALAAALSGPGGTLEAAADRAALTSVLAEALGTRADFRDGPETARLVQRFLRAAVHQRLCLDLGESLEAAAGTAAQVREGSAALRTALTTGGCPPGPEPDRWTGLEGWQYATGVLAGLREALVRNL